MIEKGRRVFIDASYLTDKKVSGIVVMRDGDKFIIRLDDGTIVERHFDEITPADYVDGSLVAEIRAEP